MMAQLKISLFRYRLSTYSQLTIQNNQLRNLYQIQQRQLYSKNNQRKKNEGYEQRPNFLEGYNAQAILEYINDTPARQVFKQSHYITRALIHNYSRIQKTQDFQENSQYIIEIFSKLLNLMIEEQGESRGIANWVEAACFFRNIKADFWANVENWVLRQEDLDLRETSQVIRALSIQNVFKVRQETYEKLADFTDMHIDQFLDQQSIATLNKCLLIQTKCFKSLGAKNIFQKYRQLCIKFEALFDEHFHRLELNSSFQISIVLSKAMVYRKYGYHDKLIKYLLDEQDKGKLKQMNMNEMSTLFGALKHSELLKPLTTSESQLIQILENDLTQRISDGRDISVKEFATIINSMGHLNMGNKGFWDKIEEFVIKNFDKMNKIDFDFILSGFCLGTLEKGSPKLWKYFAVCTIQNYGNEYEEFIQTVNLMTKNRDRKRDKEENKMLDMVIDNMIKYIKTGKHVKSMIITLYLKIIAQFRYQDMTKDQCDTVIQWIKTENSANKIAKLDLIMMIRSIIDIGKFDVEQIKELIQTINQDELKKSNIPEGFNFFNLWIQNQKYFDDEFEQTILEQLEKITSVKSKQLKTDPNMMIDLKSYQVVIFNLALYGKGSRQLWENLIAIYEEIMKKPTFAQAHYHLFSLIGFKIRASYQVGNNDDGADDINQQIVDFTKRYEEFLKTQEMKNVNYQKFKDIPKMLEQTISQREKFNNTNDQLIDEISKLIQV